MAAVWLRARAELRRRWRAWLVLATMIGIVGGVALTAAAGARRSATAFERLLAQTKAHHVEVQVQEEAPETILDQVAALPQVSASGKVALFPADDQAPGGEAEPFKWEVSAAAVLGDGLARDLDLPRIVAGREMDFDDPHEAMVSEAFVSQRNIRVGDEFTIQTAAWPEVFELFDGRFPIPSGPEVTVRIAGVWKLPHDVSLGGAEEQGLLYLSPAFARAYGDAAASFEGVMVRLHNGNADVDAFMKSARALTEDPEALSFTTQADLNADVQRAVDVMAVGLWIFAGILGAVVLLVIGQSVSRSMAIGAEDLGTLRALALDTPQRVAVASIPVIATALAGAALAVLVALVASPVTPLGFVREIEPSPGFSVDAMVLGVGGPALALALIARALGPAIRLARRAARSDGTASRHPSAIAGGAARAGFSPSAVIGMRFALEPGHGVSAVPVRTALGGVVAAMIVVVAVSSFGPNMDRLLHEPRHYGWNWDLIVFGGEDEQVVTEQTDRLVAHPYVEEVAAVTSRGATFHGEELQLFGFHHVRGTIDPTVVEGRAPRAMDEIALGSDPMRGFGLQLGDVVELSATEGGTVSFTLVGRVVPSLEGVDLGEGAVVTGEGISRVRTSTGFTDQVVRLKPGIAIDRARDRFERDFGDAGVPIPPAELLNFDRVRALPDLLAGVLVGVALAVMAHALVTAVRRRGRDLAILKTIGLGRRQVRAAVAWQATMMIAVALLIGIPAGTAAGRWAWRTTAERLGVASDPVTPVAVIAVGAFAVLVIANIVATWPARRAARTQPAVVLRSE